MTAVAYERRSALWHLVRLSLRDGIAEHARYASPRGDLGCCTDDNGRALAVLCGLPSDPAAHDLASLALDFLERAHQGAGRFHLRLGSRGTWTPDPPSDDASGRALHGLGTAVAIAPWPDVRARARFLFDEAAEFRSMHARANAHACIGAAAVLRAEPHDARAGELLAAAARALPRPGCGPGWPWPEPRLTYANALLPHALLVAAQVDGDRSDRDDAIGLLRWLVELETRDRHFSFTPVGGWAPDEPRPAFDQQPIEAWAMAEACAEAYRTTDDPWWAGVVERAAAWFMGNNDIGVRLYDPGTGGGFDGLHRHGVNENQGAESTLSLIATMVALARIRDGRSTERPSARPVAGRWASSQVPASRAASR
jgi:hypothetical protein